ncbi:hypothetical protein BRD01_15210 [Halobacteriales archaeon QS_8_65_32]|nr:MAG: hypothetical protein BRD01_15210 [Halobacteriales archaeon QS_8_65_32]
MRDRWSRSQFERFAFRRHLLAGEARSRVVPSRSLSEALAFAHVSWFEGAKLPRHLLTGLARRFHRLALAARSAAYCPFAGSWDSPSPTLIAGPKDSRTTTSQEVGGTDLALGDGGRADESSKEDWSR